MRLFKFFSVPTPQNVAQRLLAEHQRELVQAKIGLAHAQSVVQYRMDAIRALEALATTESK